jgi:hypothetical protein
VATKISVEDVCSKLSALTTDLEDLDIEIVDRYFQAIMVKINTLASQLETQVEDLVCEVNNFEAEEDEEEAD